MKQRRNSGYSADTAAKYVDPSLKLVMITTNPQISVVWKDNKPTEEVNGYNYWFIDEDGAEPFKIKFAKKLGNLSFLDRVLVKGLKACEVNGKVYFKGDSVA